MGPGSSPGRSAGSHAVAALVLGQRRVERRLGGTGNAHAAACPYGRDAVAQERRDRHTRRNAGRQQLFDQRAGIGRESAVGQLARAIVDAHEIAEDLRL
jgi:hypothetical protein